jgi:hypothetical protein
MEQFQQDKHVILEQVTDTLYADTVQCAQHLRTYIYRSPKGPLKTVNTQFYDSFGALFEITSTRPEIASETALTKRIETWLGTKNLNGDHKLIEIGLQLFREYHALLWKKGILAVRR